jgi:putative toxin-antitoxin system antitoxin component (TIGR02293 family)
MVGRPRQVDVARFSNQLAIQTGALFPLTGEDLYRSGAIWYDKVPMKPVTKAKSAGRGKTIAKRPVSAKKPKTAPKKAPPKKKIAVAPPGLAFGEFEALRKQMDLSLDELTARLGLSRATVAQRKAAGRLTNDESDKVVYFARLLGHAVHLFGDLEEARQWLKTPQRALHGAVPLDYAKTEMGAQEVENLLSQLDHSSRS